MSETDSTQPILSCDLHAGYSAYRAEIQAAVAKVLESGWYILGREVTAFEQEFSHFIGASHAIGVANGTDALHLALRACGLGPGDAAITVSHTAVATVAGIEMANVTPLLVDIDPATFTMDPQSVRDALDRSGVWASRIKAIVPVHLYGHPVDIVAIQQIAKQYGLRVIEDCSQSHGATLDGVTTGTFGDVAAYSLYPTKNLGALGDAGVVTTSNAEIADRVRLLRQYGWKTRNDSEIPGVNSRLDEMQAAILRVKLEQLATMNGERRKIAGRYDTALKSSSVRCPTASNRAGHVYHQYVIRDEQNRDELQQSLKKQGIQTLIHYPIPVHLQTAYRNRLPCLVDLTHTENAVSQILSLPMYPELPLSSVERVAAAISQLRPGSSVG